MNEGDCPRQRRLEAADSRFAIWVRRWPVQIGRKGAGLNLFWKKPWESAPWKSAPWKSAGRMLLWSWLIACASCGTGAYQDRMDKTEELLAYSSKFSRDLQPGPEAAGDTGVSLRLPIIFDNTAQRGNEQPSFVNFPGLQFTFTKYMDKADLNAAQLPVQVYVVVLDASAMEATEIMNSISVTLSNSFSDVPSVWKSLDLDTPDRKTLACKWLSVSGAQTFQDKPRWGEVTTAELGGRFDAYLHTTATKHVLTAWRCPDEMLGISNLMGLAPISMGTVTEE